MLSSFLLSDNIFFSLNNIKEGINRRILIVIQSMDYSKTLAPANYSSYGDQTDNWFSAVGEYSVMPGFKSFIDTYARGGRNVIEGMEGDVGGTTGATGATGTTEASETTSPPPTTSPSTPEASGGETTATTGESAPAPSGEVVPATTGGRAGRRTTTTVTEDEVVGGRRGRRGGRGKFRRGRRGHRFRDYGYPHGDIYYDYLYDYPVEVPVPVEVPYVYENQIEVPVYKNNLTTLVGVALVAALIGGFVFRK